MNSAMTFMPSFESQDELLAYQLQGLKWTVGHAYMGSDFYRARLDEAGISPESIKRLEDLNRLPFTSADDLRAGYPFPLLSVPLDQVVRIHASSGTTGKRKVLAYTAKDLADWAHMFARCYEMAGLSQEDRVQIAVGYGLWTAGVGFQLGCEKIGAMAVPTGPGNLDMQIEFLRDLESTVLCATSSMALIVAEEARKRGARDHFKLKKLIYGSERTSDASRAQIQQGLGVELFDIPGLTELYGPGTGLECSAHQGIHYWADYYLVEILDPVTLCPALPGETGEMVVTTLAKEAAPLIRYRTRDLTRFITEPCPCGSLLPRHDRILGRSDDMIVYRAVNIYPGQIDHILSSQKGIGSEYQIVLTRESDGKDYMTVRVECAQDARAGKNQGVDRAVATAIKKQIMVSSRVELVDHGSLPRSEGKSKRVFDHRS